MSFGFQEIKSDGIKKVAVAEVVVETSVSEAESGGASKILSVLADGKIMSIEAMIDEARVSGRVNFKIVYLDNDGAMRGLDYFADFSENVGIQDLSGNVYGRIAVIDSDTSLKNNIKLSAVLEITLFSITGNEANCFCSCDEKFYTEKDTIETQTFVTSVMSSIETTDEYDTNADISKIILFDTESFVSDVNIGMGNVLVNGGLLADVTYLVGEDVYTVPFNIPFSEELEKPELTIGQVATAEASVKSSRIVLTGVEGSNIIKVEGEVEVKLNIYAPTENEIISDIFSVENELIEEKANYISEELFETKFFGEKISGNVVLSSDMAPINDVVGILATRNMVAQAIAGDGMITIEGVLNATVMYRDDNGYNSAVVEIPYSLDFNAEGVTSENVITAVGTPMNITAKLKRNNEIEVSGDLMFKVEIFGTRSTTYIAEIAEGEEKDVNKSAISVYIAEEGDSIWDAAKALSARPDAIKEQNPDLTSPFKAGDKIIYYRQIKFEF